MEFTDDEYQLIWDMSQRNVANKTFTRKELEIAMNLRTKIWGKVPNKESDGS